jgi:hypothetical protein
MTPAAKANTAGSANKAVIRGAWLPNRMPA